MSAKAIRHSQPIDLPEAYSTLAEMLVHIAKKYPTKGVTYVDTDGAEDFVSYPMLIANARRYLKSLYQRGIKPGDVLILEIDTPKDFYHAFWACMFGGIIAAPITQPTSWEPHSTGLLKLTKIWEVLNKPTLLIEEQRRGRYKFLQETPEYEGLKFISTQELTSTEVGEIHPTKSDDLVFLQFSSGSTGTPKGVQLTNRNILMNNIACSLSIEETSEDVVVTWLPHTHDMGLFGQHLTPMIVGSNIVVFTPYTFVRSPYMFLKKITEHKGTWFCSPNFGYDWMLKKVPDEKLSTLDLSSIRFTLNGAEPISIAVVNQFIEKFSKCGLKSSVMYPAYGMAEATVGVCMGKPGSPMKVESISRSKMILENRAVLAADHDPLDAIEFAHEAHPVAGMSVRIADEQGNILDENMIGEIQIKGSSLTSGYYHLPDENKELFIDGWLRTGDLGFMSGGSLVVTGRIKDIIFVRGRNYYAHDLEEIIYASEAIQRGNMALVGLFNPKNQQEELLAFIKYKFDSKKFFSVRQNIINQLQETVGIEVTHVIPVNTIPKTTSGKLQRFHLQKSYENDEYGSLLKEIAQHLDKTQSGDRPIQLPQNELEIFLHKSWATILNIPATKISVDDSFLGLGGNSIRAYQLLGTIEKHLNREIGPEVLTLCKTIRQTAEYLQAMPATDPKQSTNWQTNYPLDIDKAVAITGIALRFPQAKNQHEFWANLRSQKECIAKISDRRKELAGKPNWDDWMAELDDIDCFDNDFFEIAPDEARFMDPQQRLILELSYEALEDAGMTPGLGEEDKNIGVYTGISANTYYQCIVNFIDEHGMTDVHPNTMVGNMHNITAASVAHQYNFTGPALAIDTACSSFMVALHYAVTALRQKAISGAVVAGANIMTTPMIHLMSRRAGIVSSTQYTLAFDKNADGSVLGEGVVVVYLEPLAKAIQEHKNIYGIVRGTAINNDGYSLGIMAPNPKGQYKVLSNAYIDANLSPDEVGYIEAHGTGTVIGDPIELNALSKLFSEGYTDQVHDIGIGSVKTNIGHLLSAAGGAGLAKVLLCLKNRTLVPSLHTNLNAINPALQIEKTPFYIVNDVESWVAKDGKTRKAGISSFGLGGTNTHTVIEEWNQEFFIQNHRKHHLLTLSAKSENALAQIVNQTKEIIEQNPGLDINDLCFTRNRYRKHYSYRATCLITTENKDAALDYATKGHSEKVRSAKTWMIIGDIKNANTQTENIIESDDLAREDFSQVNECARQYCAATGKILEPSEILYFSYWYSVSKHLQKSATKIVGISGLGSGQILADLLNGKINLEQAVSLYFTTNAEEGLHLKSGFWNFKADIVLVIGGFDRKLLNMASDEFQRKTRILIVSPGTETSPEVKLFSIIADLYTAGVNFNWEYIHPDGSGKLINLPGYPFEKKSFWVNTSPIRQKEIK